MTYKLESRFIGYPAVEDIVLAANVTALATWVGAQSKDMKFNLPQSQPQERAFYEVGKRLFFQRGGSHDFSCASCHNLATGGDDNMETSVGHGWQKGPRNSPTVLNAVLNEAQFWDGRAEDLKAQAKGPVQAGVEMANTRRVLSASAAAAAPPLLSV